MHNESQYPAVLISPESIRGFQRQAQSANIACNVLHPVNGRLMPLADNPDFDFIKR